MGRIKFIQYMMPTGRQVEQFMDNVPDDVAEKAQQIWDAGLRLEMEMLSDYRTCSFTVADPIEEVDLDCHVCVNGPLVPGVVAKMIMEFDLSKFLTAKDLS